MVFKNKDLFKELDDLMMDLPVKKILSNKELAQYFEDSNEIESGNIPESVYSVYDDEETLKELISIAKELSK